MSEMHEGAEMRREKDWTEQDAAYRRLLRLADEPTQAVYGQEELTAAIAHKPGLIHCIDERITLPTVGLGSAGSGILLTPSQRQAMADKIKMAGLEIQVSYHENCGAASLFCQRQKEASGVELDPLQEAHRAARELMTDLGLEGEPVRLGYSAEADQPMVGEPGFHPARAVIVDGTGRFHRPAIDLPASFLISARYAPDDATVVEELRIAQGIALGDHGFGARFTLETPLVVLLVGDKTASDWSTAALGSRLLNELAAAGDRVKILKMDL